jgi:3-hydroxymyristoyl/3-hydroxydecanoyl-(acyl carrier protein) dehydratase
MSEMPTRLDAADIMGVLELLPHRYPFLLVDPHHRDHRATKAASASRT